MPDITLVHCPNRLLGDPKMYFALGILYLGASLEKAGYSVAVADLRGGKVDIDLVPRAKYVGISFTTGESADAKLIARRAKERDPNCVTIAGGPHPTLLPEDCLGHFDVVFRGEGESLDPAKLERGVMTVPRIWDLESLPFPARHLADCFSETLMPGERYGHGQKATTVIFSRGCSFNCAYCGNMLRKPVVYRSPESIEAEVRELIGKYGCRAFRIEDDNFTINKKWLIRVCQRLAPLGVTFKCHSRGNLIDEETVVALKEAGCLEVGIGLESADQRVLARVNKGVEVADCGASVRLLRKHGIRSKVYFVLHLPGETEETMEWNRDFMKMYQPDRWTCSRFAPYPGSPIWDRPQSYGVTWIDPELSHYWNFSDSAVVELEGASVEELDRRYYSFYEWLRSGTWDMTSDLARRHRRWVEEEGGIEGPTYLETLMKPEQQRRIRWLMEHCWTEKEILDIGCNRGYILEQVGGKCGVDINPENTELAREEFPHRWFRTGDVTEGLDFEDGSFDVVIEADLLEHLEWFQGVERALSEGVRIARRKLLITLPWRKDDKCALCFKHRWLVTEEKVSRIGMWLMAQCESVSLERDGAFLYLQALCRDSCYAGKK